MANIISEGHPIVPPHSCKDELPGGRDWISDYLHDINPGTIARCACGKLYVAEQRSQRVYWFSAGPVTRWKCRKLGRSVEA